jgi:hypothetical protein
VFVHSPEALSAGLALVVVEDVVVDLLTELGTGDATGRTPG